MTYIGMVIPMGYWTYTSEPAQAWTLYPLHHFMIPQSLRTYHELPEATALPSEFTEISASLDRSLDLTAQNYEARHPGVVNGTNIKVEHIELFLFESGSEPTHEELVASIYADIPLRDRPVAHYRFDGAVGMRVGESLPV